ncbi:histidinol dehydrogenase [Ascosphaera apis ARSEF 7405]|uniref:Histidinol dehydrogenase n=1 Tax=Ascosphaera apis ARSEF 7405 TaxID=392613 RepID=A0A168DSK8_9EURO|nr:histidinol dehydrogenase [Ascosphaera apis ARSEF 7405]
MKFQGRTFIISGGSSGLGLATATALLEQGANVSIFDMNPPAAEGHFTDKRRVQYNKADVSNSSSLQAAIDNAVAWTKETDAPLGGVITCAGVGFGERALPRQDPSSTTVKTMSMERFDKVIAINLRGTVDLIRLALPHIAATPGEGEDEERGVIIVVSSVAAYEGQVGQLAYSASKAAVAGLVLPLAREVGRTAGVRVVGIAPAVFQTNMTAAPRPAPGAEGKARGGVASQSGTNTGMIEYPQRLGKPQEFASLALECIRNPMMNGQVFRLDGAVRFPSRL